MRYLEANMSRFNEIGLNINIDGAGYKEGFSAFSFYGLPDTMSSAIKTVISHFPGITEGSPWVQGDHSMFIQQGCPAIAVSSQWFTEHIDDQQLTHTARDDVDMVDCRKLVEIAYALKELVE